MPMARRCTRVTPSPRAPPPPTPLLHAPTPRSVLIVEQVPGHSQLRTVDEGLDLLRSVRGPIAPVVVIGPYRSGKSFLLNQLLGVTCGEDRRPWHAHWVGRLGWQGAAQ